MLQKRRSVFLLTVLAVVVVLAFAMFAVACTPASDQDDTSTEDDTWVKNDGLTYKKNDDGTYQFYKCADDLTSVTILAEVNGKAVTSIAVQAFYECYDLESVVIPDSVTEIGNEAFYSCIGLKEVVIPDAVTTIKSSAFWHCEGLVRVTLGENLQSIGDSAFAGCFRLVEIVNKSSISLTAGSTNNGYAAYYARNIIDDVADTKIAVEGDYTLYDESVILTYTGSDSSLTIAEGITEIGSYAFANCTSLESVVLPESIEKINAGAFRNTGLTSITFPENLEYIGVAAFEYCSSLESAAFMNKNGWYCKNDNGESPLPASMWPTDDYVAKMWLVSNAHNDEYIRK